MEYFEFRAMNTEIVLAAEGEPDKLASGFETTRIFIDRSEQRFSRFLTTSELTRLNCSQGEWFEASPELFEVLKLAQHYYHETQGLFDPSILPDLKRAGYDRSIDEIRVHGANSNRKSEINEKPEFEDLWLEEQTHKIWLPVGMGIDLGGIAKGWIAEQAAIMLARDANACAVNAGGDLCLIGIPEGQSYWEIGLEDPRNPEKNLTLLKVGPGAVATSSVTKRTWQQEGKRQHHLIDPRSGEPAVTDWVSVTVVAPQGATAEVFAKALLIAGSEKSEHVLAGNSEITFIAVDPQGRLWGSPNSKELFYENL